MKRSILFGIVGIAAAMVTSSSYGQGAILLGNYISSSNIPSQIMLGGSPISTGGYTVGIYWVAGNVVGSVSADPTGIANPATLGGGLAVGTGLGSTAALVGSGFGYPGAYLAGNVFVTGLAASSVITVEVVAYNGPSYLDPLTTFRGHSSAFAMTTTSAPTPNNPMTGVLETDGGFNVHQVPEPTTLALGGLGGLALLFLRRKQA